MNEEGGAIKKRIELLDGFGASGIRGLRYAKENKKGFVVKCCYERRRN